MFSYFSKLFFIFIFIIGLVWAFLIFATPVYSGTSYNLEEICKSDQTVDNECQKLSKQDCRVLLENCLKYYEAESEEFQKNVTQKQAEKKTLQNQIYILENKIKQLDSQIYQSNLIIKDLKLQILDTQDSIDKTSLKIKEIKGNLTNILQLSYENDKKSYLEIFLAEEKISDFFNELMALESLNSKTQELLGKIKGLKSDLENQKDLMVGEKDESEKAVILQELQKKEQQGIQKEKSVILEKTKGEETLYQNYLAQSEKKAAEIRARIFELIGVPKAPTFGEVYEIAKYIKSVTGVRPALLLAVMTQESNIGKNVGQCYLKNPETGSGIVVYNSREISRVMNPQRDIPYFLEITKELGRDSYNTPVSCPMSFGWGGAMGPAQFIPDTWANPKYGYGQKVKEVTGKPADPWNIKDAFLAAGLYLRDLGASQDEFKAVMRYFSGYSWSKWEESYGRSVLSIASQYEEDIKQIEGL